MTKFFLLDTDDIKIFKKVNDAVLLQNSLNRILRRIQFSVISLLKTQNTVSFPLHPRRRSPPEEGVSSTPG
ncbi:Hypothetical protein NTJ_08832 [Nesidiocoris tenuis]|uniref:Uncharacterized protein n=1 Tax=Nesidiocoris tenuis TaxID=355587 RepID=A0ABN7AVQ2_9HEMI|nr:Hypothetical protein NTJ_08832 [Nesidiocoris tenuis]